MPDSPATPDAGSADGFDLFGSQPTPAPSVAPVAGNPPVQTPSGPEAGTPTPPPPPEEPYDPRTDPRRFEYHQSRADKALSQLKEVEPYLPVVKYIQQNPHILEAVEADLSKQSAGTRVEAPKPPDRPKKPEAYSKEDAGSPGTASWQYHQDLLEYSANFADYQLQREQYTQYQQEMARRQQTAQEQERQYLMSVAQQAQQQYGLSPEEVPGFLEYYTNPQYTTQQLVQLWRYQRNLQLRQQSQGGQAPAPMGPPPVGATPGMSQRLPQQPMGPEQQFEGDFLNEYKRLRTGIPSNRPR